MFPDSKDVNKFSCSQTETPCILNNTISLLVKQNLLAGPSRFVNDGSRDNGLKEWMPCVCSYFMSKEVKD